MQIWYTYGFPFIAVAFPLSLLHGACTRCGYREDTAHDKALNLLTKYNQRWPSLSGRRRAKSILSNTHFNLSPAPVYTRDDDDDGELTNCGVPSRS